MNAAYEALLIENVDIYYVMLDDAENTATLDYCNQWKGLNGVAPPVVADYGGFMWGFLGKQPGTAIIVDKLTMEILEITDKGDIAVGTKMPAV